MSSKKQGNVFKDINNNPLVRSISQYELINTILYISKVIDIQLKSVIYNNVITQFGLEDSLLGSSGKNRHGIIGKKIILGDIDIAIDERIYSYNELYDTLCQSFGLHFVNRTMEGMGIISAQVQVSGKVNNGYVQVDFMIGNIELLLFTYNAPDNIYFRSNYSGACRNVMITAITQCMRKKILDSNIGNVIAYYGPSYLLNKGIVQQYRHFPLRKDGKGRVQKLTVISRDIFNSLYCKNRKHNITNNSYIISDPTKIIEFLFHTTEISINDIQSLEDICDAILFYLPNKAEMIFKRFKCISLQRHIQIDASSITEI